MSIFGPPTTDEHGNCTMILTGMAGGGQLRCILGHHEPGTYQAFRDDKGTTILGEDIIDVALSLCRSTTGAGR